MVPTSNTNTSVTLKKNVPQDVVTILNDNQAFPNNFQKVRVMLFSQGGLVSQTGLVSETRLLALPSQVSGNTISWTRPLPNNNKYYPLTSMSPNPNPGAITQVRIQVQEQRYTWLLTVRNYTSDLKVPQALVDVVIFFNRSPSIQDETPYTLTAAGNSQTYSISFTGKAPYVKKGGFMLDTQTGTWHRIQKVVEATGSRTIHVGTQPAGGNFQSPAIRRSS